MLLIPSAFAKTRYALAAIVASAAICSFGWNAGAQPANPPQNPPPSSASKSVWDGVYTSDQAKRGADVSARECESCHGEGLAGDQAPPLTGAPFVAEWNGQTLEALFAKISKTMPQTAPGKLTNQEYTDLTADILSLNGFPAGKAELDGQPESLQQIRIDAAKPPAK